MYSLAEALQSAEEIKTVKQEKPKKSYHTFLETKVGEVQTASGPAEIGFRLGQELVNGKPSGPLIVTLGYAYESKKSGGTYYGMNKAIFAAVKNPMSWLDDLSSACFEAQEALRRASGQEIVGYEVKTVKTPVSK